MVRSYTRYELDSVFGVIASSQSNAIFARDAHSKGSGRAIVPALERVIVWDVKKGEKVLTWVERDCKVEVTCIAQSPADHDIFAVGYADGFIRLWSLQDENPVIVPLNGHRSAITALTFDGTGTRLASGSRDTHVVLWDIIAEQGISRLKGHRDQITALEFVALGGEKDATHLLSTSKDSYLKLWELATQHCVETHTAHRGECWTMSLSPDAKVLATGGLEGELKFWSIDHTANAAKNEKVITSRGSLTRQSRARPVTLAFHPNGQYLAAQSADKAIEIFRLRSEEEIEKRLKRRRKRKDGKKGEIKTEDDEIMEDESLQLEDHVVSYVTIRAPHRIRSVDWGRMSSSDKTTDDLTLLAVSSNNSICIYSINRFETLVKKSAIPDYTTPFALELPGHQTDVRAICLSSASDVLATASDGALKLWNVNSGACIRTFQCGYALCISFILNDKYIVLGTKEGDIELFEVASSTLVESISAHQGALWSLQVHPDGRNLVTGSADKSVKFWRFETVNADVAGTKRQVQRLTLKHAKTLKLTEDVLSVRFSPDSRLLAVSLLNAQVQVFFADTLKFLFPCYGHKLPVLNMDISSDSKMLVTCSADKNVKLWGLDFGDIHRSIFAHNDAILQVQFEKEGHNFFTSSRDKMVKYWDGDKWENILRLDGHHAEVSAIAISGDSEFFVSSGHDKSIRVWRQTDDPVFLEEEREKELEEIYENQLADTLQRTDMNDGDQDEEAGRAGQATTETLMAGEKIMEALEIGEADRLLMLEYERERIHRPTLTVPPRNPILSFQNNISAERHVLNVCQKVQPSHLEDALLVLPFEKVIIFLTFLDLWAKRAWNMPLTTKILVFLVKTHHSQIVANHIMRPMLDSVRRHLREALVRQKDLMGFNLAALTHVTREWSALNQKDFSEPVEGATTKKRAFTTLL